MYLFFIFILRWNKSCVQCTHIVVWRPKSHSCRFLLCFICFHFYSVSNRTRQNWDNVNVSSRGYCSKCYWPIAILHTLNYARYSYAYCTIETKTEYLAWLFVFVVVKVNDFRHRCVQSCLHFSISYFICLIHSLHAIFFWKY